MTRDDIIRMALEHFGAVLKPSDLEVKLAALAVAAEREACAKVCESLRDSFLSPQYATGQPMSSIRERFRSGKMRRTDSGEERSMKPDIYKLIEMCVESGVAYGLTRAYKHNDAPTPEQIQEKIRQAIMHEICEWFKFDPVAED